MKSKVMLLISFYINKIIIMQNIFFTITETFICEVTHIADARKCKLQAYGNFPSPFKPISLISCKCKISNETNFRDLLPQ